MTRRVHWAALAAQPGDARSRVWPAVTEASVLAHINISHGGDEQDAARTAADLMAWHRDVAHGNEGVMHSHRAESYPDRWQDAVERGATLTIFVPAMPDALPILAPRTAIVGKHLANLEWMCHYEGWKHGAMQYADLDARGQWEAGVRHAAGRALTQYPTVARALINGDRLRAIGVYSARDDSITVDDEEALTAWLT